MNLKQRDGHTALMKATRVNNLTIASELVNWGADTTITDDKGYTPLKAALMLNFNEKLIKRNSFVFRFNVFYFKGFMNDLIMIMMIEKVACCVRRVYMMTLQ